MANHLPLEKKALVLSLLTEGQSIRATGRITGVDTKTIMSLLVSAGDKARDIHDTMMQNLQCKQIQADELYAFVGMKQRHVRKGEESKYGDFYTFVALDADTKLVPVYRVSKRDGRTAASFMMELSIRVTSRFQLSTDSFAAYETAVDRVFGSDIDYAQIHKEYEETVEGQRRYSPARIIRINKKVISGRPQEERICTSHVESQNLTVRMHSRRFTRLTNGFSRKLRNLEAAVDLHYFFHNFIKIHKTLRVTPAMEAKVTNRLWNWEDLLTWNESAKAA